MNTGGTPDEHLPVANGACARERAPENACLRRWPFQGATVALTLVRHWRATKHTDERRMTPQTLLAAHGTRITAPFDALTVHLR